MIETAGGPDQNVVGSVSIVFSWDTLMNRILPDYIKGMICVLESSQEEFFTYSISGDKVTLLGAGDRHDPNYEHMGESVEARLLLEGDVKYVTYTLHMYPSEEFEAQYVTNKAAIFTAGVVLIFLLTAGLFLLYDYLVEDRQKRTARLARQTANIVDTMFPAMFRERLFRSHEERPVERRSSALSTASGGSVSETRKASNLSSGGAEDEKGSGTPSSPFSSAYSGKSMKRMSTTMSSAIGGKVALKQIDKFMKGIRAADPEEHNPMLAQRDGVDDEPIADLFLDTSIMFSDIVGECTTT